MNDIEDLECEFADLRQGEAVTGFEDFLERGTFDIFLNDIGARGIVIEAVASLVEFDNARDVEF